MHFSILHMEIYFKTAKILILSRHNVLKFLFFNIYKQFHNQEQFSKCFTLDKFIIQNVFSNLYIEIYIKTSKILILSRHNVFGNSIVLTSISSFIAQNSITNALHLTSIKHRMHFSILHIEIYFKKAKILILSQHNVFEISIF